MIWENDLMVSTERHGALSYGRASLNNKLT